MSKTLQLSPSGYRLYQHPKIQLVGNGDMEIFHAPDFVLPAACEEIIAYADRNNRPSEIADHNGDYAFRTSTTSNLDPNMPVVAGIRNAIAGLIGLPLENGEPLQAQRYLPGQEFKLHCDWFRPGSPDYTKFCAISGQRTWTAMAYLNDVDEGGQTIFPHLGLSVTPKRGDLLIWNNLRPNGDGEPKSGHHAMPVIKGAKYVITQWFRQKPYR